MVVADEDAICDISSHIPRMPIESYMHFDIFSLMMTIMSSMCLSISPSTPFSAPPTNHSLTPPPRPDSPILPILCVPHAHRLNYILYHFARSHNRSPHLLCSFYSALFVGSPVVAPAALPRPAPTPAARAVRVSAKAKTPVKGAKGAKAAPEPYVCRDCGYVYVPRGNKTFESLPASYKCPECAAPKSKVRDPRPVKPTEAYYL